jgi:hypothetical protein
MNRATNKFHCDLRHPTKKEMKKIKHTTPYRDQRIIALKVIDWCLEEFKIHASIKLKLGEYSDFKCWGQCYEGTGEHQYTIEIAKDQTLRDFIATVVHEMIHVEQWETGEWRGDGEAEAERWQYLLTSKLWNENII